MNVNDIANNKYFKMGAVTAIGEMFSEGLLGPEPQAAPIVRSYLESFGVPGPSEAWELGVRGTYLTNVERAFAE